MSHDAAQHGSGQHGSGQHGIGPGEHWSIGEVLALLQEDFPEVTISKIRFLESQGLINPERTPSGYRRFYGTDFDRIRWILTQQRDNYLPLKVIRDRLFSGEPLDALEAGPGDLPSGELHQPEPSALEAFLAAPLVDLTDGAAASAGPSLDEQAVATRDVAALWDELASDVAAALIDQPVRTATLDLVTHSDRTSDHEPFAETERSQQEQPVSEPDTAIPDDPITREELATLSGCDQVFLHELERFRLIEGQKVGGSVLFDPRSVAIAKLAATFGANGLDPRHLRTYRLAAEREVGLIAQVVEPGLRRRDPGARREVFAQLESLAAASSALHAALVESVIAEQFPDRLF